jgi:fucose 4-O-acetylase-like acetyltransferase
MATAVQSSAADSAKSVPQSVDATASRPGLLVDVERAKGFAIILVVLGHIVAREPPRDNGWYVVLKSAFYTFHMPFFMYLGGLVFYHVGDALNPRPTYWHYLVRRAERLLIPFLLLGLLILFGKLAVGTVVQVDNSPPDIWFGLKSLFWNTGQSPATSVWYILVLFIYCGITPVLVKLSSGRLWPVLVIAAALHLLNLPEIAYLDRVAFFFVYFVIGCVAGRYQTEAMQLIDTTLPHSAAVFSMGIVLAVMGIQPALTGTICALSSLAFLHGLMRTTWLSRSDALLWFGRYSFAIYLFNTLAIGFSKGLLLKVMPWDGVNFLAFFPNLLLSGLMGPILLKRTLLDQIPWLGRLTR